MLNFIVITFLSILSFGQQYDSSNNDGFTFENQYACGCTQFTIISNASTEEKYEWTFGDNSMSTEKNPQHCYQAFGSYSVTLNIYHTDGTQTIHNQSINWSYPEN